MLTTLLVFRRSGDGEALGVNKFLRSGPVFVGSAVRVSFIFVEVIGEALDLFVFSEGRW
jgi:hypothetical protein